MTTGNTPRSGHRQKGAGTWSRSIARASVLATEGKDGELVRWVQPTGIVSAAALVRTSVRVAKIRADGRRLAPFDKMIQFFVSVAVVLVVGVPVLVSFMLVTAVCMMCEIHPLLAFVGAIVAASGAGYGGYRLVVVAIQEWNW